MDRSLFLSTAPGSLVVTDGGEAAFVPQNLAPTITLPASTLALYAEAMEGIGELRGVTTSGALPDPEIALSSLRRKEARASSTIEGTTVSEEQLVRFSLAGRDDARSPSDAREVQAYFRALDQGEAAMGARPLDLWLIRAMHATLLDGVRGRDLSPGAFRTGQVHIGSDHRFTPAPGHLVGDLMEALEAYIRAPDDALPPLVRAFLVHYQFETIHPFRDGNGRIGRVLLALLIWKWCGLPRPWCYVSPFLERHRDEYMHGLFRVSTDGAWIPWIDLCLRAVRSTCDDTVKRIHELAALRAKWIALVSGAGMKSRAVTIVDSLLRLPAITRSVVTDVAGVSFNTASRDLKKLERLGIVEQSGDGREQVYLARDVLRIADDA